MSESSSSSRSISKSPVKHRSRSPRKRKSRSPRHRRDRSRSPRRERSPRKYHRENNRRSYNKRKSQSPERRSHHNRDSRDRWGKKENEKKEEIIEQDAGFNLGLSGVLDEGENVKKGVQLKYNEPVDGRVPDISWRLYIWKDDEIIDTIFLDKQSYYLFGREKRVAHIPVEHESCSKQHAVIQFRLREITDEVNGSTSLVIRPYIFDIESTNGTFLNGEKIDPNKYYELLEQDVIKFAESTRDYVVLNAESAENQKSE